MALKSGAGVPWMEPPCLLSIAWQPAHACSAMALPRATSTSVWARAAIVGAATIITASAITLLVMTILLNPRFHIHSVRFLMPNNPPLLAEEDPTNQTWGGTMLF